MYNVRCIDIHNRNKNITSLDNVCTCAINDYILTIQGIA